MLKYFFFILIAALFHTSVLFLIPIYFIVIRPAWSKAIVWSLLGFALLFVLYDLVMNILFVFLEGSRYAAYEEVMKDGGRGVNILRILVAALPVALSFIFRKELVTKYRGADVVTNMVLFSLMITLLSTKEIYFSRMSGYFSIYQLLLFPYLVGVFKKKNTYSGDSSHEWGFGIDIRGGTNINISGMDIHDMTGDAIGVGGKDNYLTNGGSIAKNIVIEDSKLHDCRRQGITVYGAQSVYIRNCEIYNIGIANGTAPGAGIDLENELDWPVRDIHIQGNHIYNNKAASVIVDRNVSFAAISSNTLDGHVVLTRGGEHTTIEENTIINSSIYSVDSTIPIYTVIQKNNIVNGNIEIATNFGTIIVANTITDGYIKFNYSSGAIYDNVITNSGENIKTAIQVYADKQADGYAFEVYMSNNDINGAYSSESAVSNIPLLQVVTDEVQTMDFINTFGTVDIKVPSGHLDDTDLTVPLANNTTTIIVIISATVILLIAIGLLTWKKRQQKSNNAS